MTLVPKATSLNAYVHCRPIYRPIGLFWPKKGRLGRRPVLRAGGCFRGGVFADVLLFSSGFGSYRCHDLFGTGFDRVNTVLLIPKYDPDSLSPSFLSLFFLLLRDEGFPTVYCVATLI